MDLTVIYWTFTRKKIAILAAILSLSACGGNDGANKGSDAVGNADGFAEDGSFLGSDDNFDNGFPNNGSIGGSILEDGKLIAGNRSEPQKGFVCRQSASFDAGAYIEVGGNGLIGDVLGGLLGILSGDGLNNLLNGISDSVLALDGDLRTAAVVTQAISGLGGILNSMDVTISMPEGQFMPVGSYAVFAVSFPPSLLELGVLSGLRVSTFIGDAVQERGVRIDASTVGLLGFSTRQIGNGNNYALIGYKTTKPYDKAQLSISSALLSLDLGDKLYIHEFCTAGDLVDPPVQN